LTTNLIPTLLASLILAGGGDGFIHLDVCDEEALAEAEQELQDAIDAAEAALGSEDPCAFITEADEYGRNGVSRIRRAQATLQSELNDCQPYEDPFAVPAFDYTAEEWARFALFEDAVQTRLDVVCMCPPEDLFSDEETYFRDEARCESFNYQCEGRAERLICAPPIQLAPPILIPVDEPVCGGSYDVWAAVFTIFVGPGIGHGIAELIC